MMEIFDSLHYYNDDPWITMDRYDSFYDMDNPINLTKLMYRHINKLHPRDKKILKNWLKLSADGCVNSIEALSRKFGYPSAIMGQLLARARWQLYCEVKREEMHYQYDLSNM